MNIRHMKSFTALCGISLTLVLSMISIAEAAPKQPDSGSGDCYNRATKTCNKKHPGKDMGDTVYSKCIDDHLDWCDKNEPAAKRPGTAVDRNMSDMKLKSR